MARRFDRSSLRQSISLRQRFLEAVQAFNLRNATDCAQRIETLSRDYRQLADSLGDLDEAVDARHLADATSIAVHLCRWTAATLSAEPDAHRYHGAARSGCAVLQQELGTCSTVTTQSIRTWCAQVIAVTEITQVPLIVSNLARMPLPVFYSRGANKNNIVSNGHIVSQDPDSNPAVVAKLMFSLDGQSLLTPQAISSKIQYDFTVAMAVNIWPEGYDILQVDYVSTLAPDSYRLSTFFFSFKDGNKQQMKGHCIFQHAQSLLSEPVIIRARAHFVKAGGEQSLPATIIGHPELTLRVFEQNSYPVLSGYPIVDIQIPKIIRDAQSALPDINPRDFEDFTQCLIFLSRYAASVLQTGVFKGKKVLETRDFQQSLLLYLRGTELSADVREGERATGGILDIQYRNIVIELKVETSISDRTKLRAAYIEQPAQYTAHNVPLSIACILDMTEKQHPPANVANNITLETPVVHGFEADAPPYPSKVAVIIIDGNIKSPSDYS